MTTLLTMIVLFAVATAIMMIVFFTLTLVFEEEAVRERRTAPVGAPFAHTGLREVTSLSLTRQTTWRRFLKRSIADERARVAPAQD